MMNQVLTIREIRNIRPEAYKTDQVKREEEKVAPVTAKYHLNMCERKLPVPIACFSENERSAYRKNKTEDSRLFCLLNHINTQEKVSKSSHLKDRRIVMKKCMSYRTKALDLRSKSALKNCRTGQKLFNSVNNNSKAAGLRTFLQDGRTDIKSTTRNSCSAGMILSHSNVVGGRNTETRCRTALTATSGGVYIQTSKDCRQPLRSQSCFSGLPRMGLNSDDIDTNRTNSKLFSHEDFAFADEAISAVTINLIKSNLKQHANKSVLSKTSRAVGDIKWELRELQKLRKNWQPKTFNFDKAVDEEKQFQGKCKNRMQDFTDRLYDLRQHSHKRWEVKNWKTNLI